MTNQSSPTNVRHRQIDHLLFSLDDPNAWDPGNREGVKRSIAHIVQAGDTIDQRALIDKLSAWPPTHAMSMLFHAHGCALKSKRKNHVVLYLDAWLNVENRVPQSIALDQHITSVVLRWLVNDPQSTTHPLISSAAVLGSSPVTYKHAVQLIRDHQDHPLVLGAIQSTMVILIHEKDQNLLHQWFKEVVQPLGKIDQTSLWEDAMPSLVHRLFMGPSIQPASRHAPKKIGFTPDAFAQWAQATWPTTLLEPLACQLFQEHITKIISTSTTISRDDEKNKNLLQLIKSHLLPAQWSAFKNQFNVIAQLQVVQSILQDNQVSLARREAFAQEVITLSHQPKRWPKDDQVMVVAGQTIKPSQVADVAQALLDKKALKNTTQQANDQSARRPAPKM